MRENEIQEVRNFINERMTRLLKHESEQKKNSRNFGFVGFDPSKYFSFTQNNKNYYIVSGRVFNEIINNVLLEATEKYPHLFGTGNAKDVIKAVYDTEPFGDENHFEFLLKVETFGLLIEVDNGKINPKILRLDLFRDVEENKSGTFDFTGGLFHVYKHFSCKGVPLSNDKMQTDIIHPSVIIPVIAKAFFEGTFEPTDRKDTFKVTIQNDNSKELILFFYHEKDSDVYFINSAREQTIKTKKD